MREMTSVISRRVREREVRRQLLYNRLRRAGIRLVPALLREFLKLATAALIGYWIVAELLAYVGGPRPLYTLTALALVYSLQATYYKYRLSVDPRYRIPNCNCAGSGRDDTEAVLRSRHSSVLRIPNSVLGSLLYSAVLVLVYLDERDAAMQLAILAVLASLYLSYLMVFKITSLCTTCINVAVLNVLILLQFVR
jgi:uncharacterized membrane protein